ncbi:MAG: TIGR00730 family Rossman fold protein [Proteobacteria bacterium]|nr:TIGR00730 family Rossman fold protein [Pseudomonadota bacterium]
MTSMNSICVFAGAGIPQNPSLMADAEAIGNMLAKHGLGMIYGAGQRGMMGAVAKGALDRGGHVHGIIPRFLLKQEASTLNLADPDISQLTITKTMHGRKQRMYDLASAFLVLPGGYGTMEEMLEVITWCQLKVHSKPVYIYNRSGFWSPMHAMFVAAHQEGFISDTQISLPRMLNTMDEVEKMMAEITRTPPPKIKTTGETLDTLSHI